MAVKIDGKITSNKKTKQTKKASGKRNLSGKSVWWMESTTLYKGVIKEDSGGKIVKVRGRNQSIKANEKEIEKEIEFIKLKLS